MRFLRIMRPSNWTKNIFVFAALVFGHQLSGPSGEVLMAVGSALGCFACFSLASSAAYVFNDIIDRRTDRLHPEKRNRPIAAGAVSVGSAAVLCAVCAAAAIVGSYVLDGGLVLIIAMYLVLIALYSLALKKMMILDCVIIAIGFCLRAVAGAVVLKVDISPWLVICTFMLCLFIGFGKRRCEIAMIGNTHAMRGHRPTLVRYTPDLLTHLLSTSGGIAIITFLLYTLDTTWKSPFEASKQNLIYTLPLVVYGVYRYAMLIELGKGSGPTDLLIKDPPFLLAIILWVLAALFILYRMPAEWGLGIVG